MYFAYVLFSIIPIEDFCLDPTHTHRTHTQMLLFKLLIAHNFKEILKHHNELITKEHLKYQYTYIHTLRYGTQNNLQYFYLVHAVSITPQERGGNKYFFFGLFILC